jgi:hypothetical protein
VLPAEAGLKVRDFPSSPGEPAPWLDLTGWASFDHFKS